MPFDIRQLRHAIAAADHGSFYRAARALDVEQSTLSRSVQKLERIVGTAIFERSRAGVSMTTAGKAFIRGARPMVATADNLMTIMRAVGQGRAGVLIFGHNSSVSAGNLRATIMNWRDTYPDVEIECVEADRGALLAGLDSGEIDIAFLLGEIRHADLRILPLWSERIFLALSTINPLAKSEIIHWTDLRCQRVLLPVADPGAELRDMLLGRLGALGRQPEIHMRRSSRETLLSTLGGGLDVTIVCEGSIGARYPEVVYRPIHGEQGQALAGYSAYWRDERDNAALQRFLVFVGQRYALSFDLPKLGKQLKSGGL